MLKIIFKSLNVIKQRTQTQNTDSKHGNKSLQYVSQLKREPILHRKNSENPELKYGNVDRRMGKDVHRSQESIFKK